MDTLKKETITANLVRASNFRPLTPTNLRVLAGDYSKYDITPLAFSLSSGLVALLALYLMRSQLIRLISSLSIQSTLIGLAIAVLIPTGLVLAGWIIYQTLLKYKVFLEVHTG